MAAGKQTSSTESAPTRPRLQSVNQDFSDFSEQLRQVAHIIGLPDSWETIGDDQDLTSSIQHLVRARAEWVLRWILDKLKDEGDAGKEARSNPASWQLLDLMVHVLPVSRSAPHLRDASFPAILERTLSDSWGQRVPPEASPSIHDVHMSDTTDSSGTMPNTSSPSRKRKRGAHGASPTKRAIPGSVNLEELFFALKRVLRSIDSLATSETSDASTVQSELIKMALRTESAQAARILGLWLSAVRNLRGKTTTAARNQTSLDISQVLHIWELRIVEAGDETSSSSEDFSAECLIPALALATQLQVEESKIVDQALGTTIEKLLARYLLAPARTAFNASSAPEAAFPPQAEALASYIQPLNAKLLQAAQIEDTQEKVPQDLELLYQAVPYLLDLAIRSSPAKTTKSRVAEKPWIEAVFAVLSTSMGCSLEKAPDFPPSKLATKSLQGTLQVLQAHDFSLRSTTLRNIFFFYAERETVGDALVSRNWPLTAALIRLEPTLFTTTTKDKNEANKHQSRDLAEAVFRRISSSEAGVNISNTKDLRISDRNLVSTPASNEDLIVEEVVVPIMASFARSRNLLGFFRHWDEQLTFSYSSDLGSTMSIWNSRIMSTSLTEIFEQSLTQKQIVALVEEHARRLHEYSESLLNVPAREVTLDNIVDRKTSARIIASLVIISAILRAIHSDDNLNALRGQLRSLLKSSTILVGNKHSSLRNPPALVWLTLCQLLVLLWPIDLHASAKSQKELVLPPLNKAVEVIKIGPTDEGIQQDLSARQAASMLFLLDACEKLSLLPGFAADIKERVAVLIEALELKQMTAEDHAKVLELLSTQYLHLLNSLEPHDIKSTLATIIRLLSSLEPAISKRMMADTSQAILSASSLQLQNAFTSILVDELKSNKQHGIATTMLSTVKYMQPSVLSREKREVILDYVTVLLEAGPIGNSEDLLSVMIRLMDQPNASANISKSGKAIFKIADSLQQNVQLSPVILQQLQTMAGKTLAHIIPNRDQLQNDSYINELGKEVKAIVKGSEPCGASRLAVLRAIVLEQKDVNILSGKHYIKLLKQYLKNDDDIASSSVQHVLDAINEIPMLYLQDATFFSHCQSWLQAWIKENTDLSAYMSVTSQCPVELAEYIGRLHTTVARFKLYPDLGWFVKFTLKVLSEPMSDRLQRKAYSTIKLSLATLEVQEKLNLVQVLTKSESNNDAAARYRIFSVLVSTFSDKLSSNPESKQRQLAVLSQLCTLLASTSDGACFNALVDCIDNILNTKFTYVTQHGIESVLSVLVKLSSGTSPALSTVHAADTYGRICETTRLLLLVHRSRLGGRLHLLLPLLQNLLFCLFVPNSGRSGTLPIWLRGTSASRPIHLTPENASQYTRVLSTLCNPPQSSIARSSHQKHASGKSKDLNDPIKAAREKTSGFLYPLLASFCRFQLSGRLDADVRQKLMPGLWDVLGTAGMKREVLDAMFSGLKGPEKDVWRGIWGEWERVHGRKEIFVGGDDN